MQDSRTLVELQGLLSDSTCILKAEPGALDISYSFFQFTYWFTLQASDYDVIIIFCVNSVSLEVSFKKCNVIMT